MANFRHFPVTAFSSPAIGEFEAANFEFGDQEWEVPVNRNSRDYLKWVQQSLNQIMGLRLAVDGDIGPQTRSAIRSFQQRQGLAADGIVGAQTEAAIKAALAQTAPAPTQPPAPPRAPDIPNPSTKPKTDDSRALRWFQTGGTPPMQPIRSGNLAISLVGGAATFAAMVSAMRTANSEGHYIYLIGWTLTDSFELIPGDSTTTIQALFSRASQNGVQVRAMLWDQPGTQNTDEVKRINRLSHGAAILDNRTISKSWKLNVGAHHQKILIVKGGQGLISFCGGVDINPNRIMASSGGGSGSGSGSGGGGGNPLHDVHCQITGPAAHDLLRIFLERWQDHPEHGALDRAKGALLALSEPLPKAVGNHYIQIGRTYGNSLKYGDMVWRATGGYHFAPHGEQTIRRMVLHAISQAQHYIYLEDQYLVNMEVSTALVRALPRLQHVTIVIPHTSLLDDTECPQDFRQHRAAFIAPLVAAGGNKVRVFHLHPPGAPNTYVHAKLWILDDEFVIVGSANCNRRGYLHDSEVMAGIYDPDLVFAKQLRISLWAKHLNMDTTAGRAALSDGVAGARFWLSLPAGAHVAPFNHLAPIATSNAIRCSLASWDGDIDPDGS